MNSTTKRFGGAALAFGLITAAARVYAQPAEPTVIPVQLTEFHYSPASIDLQQGHSYVLRVSNVGGVAHDLSAKAFFRTVTFAPGSADKVRDGDIEVPKGETVDVAFATGKAGDYEMRCTHPLHAMFGMKGHVIVH
ncbi:cupredoxin domain-containing protein [Caulobacter sp. S45]|uniref:cupredoxin domain-containing protein n=1 Tax=Caulobacter sp. S45 TaxID=1641861 RepID=UPI00131C7AFB|nr:cupredoxin domain-containing protein [Caulobacter sp. S45]